MSRYIDAKWLQESLELADECKDCKRNVDKCVYNNIDVDVVCNAVDDAPSIEIVRCKECKHWNKSAMPALQSPNAHPCLRAFSIMLSRADDFCSRGERREP